MRGESRGRGAGVRGGLNRSVETTTSMMTGKAEEAGMMTESEEGTGMTGTGTVAAQDVMIITRTETEVDMMTVAPQSLIVTVALTYRGRNPEVKKVTAAATKSRMSIVTRLTSRRSPGQETSKTGPRQELRRPEMTRIAGQMVIRVSKLSERPRGCLRRRMT